MKKRLVALENEILILKNNININNVEKDETPVENKECSLDDENSTEDCDTSSNDNNFSFEDSATIPQLDGCGDQSQDEICDKCQLQKCTCIDLQKVHDMLSQALQQSREDMHNIFQKTKEDMKKPLDQW